VTAVEVSDVTGTLHTTEGDIEMGAPRRIVLNGQVMRFIFGRHYAREAGNAFALTLRMGTETLRKAIEPPVHAERGEAYNAEQAMEVVLE
jgi:hypothetical protein